METIVPVGDVVDNSDRTVWFHQTVLTFDYVSITFFVLSFMISGVVIVDTVFEGVSRMFVLYTKTDTLSILKFCSKLPENL